MTNFNNPNIRTNFIDTYASRSFLVGAAVVEAFVAGMWVFEGPYDAVMTQVLATPTILAAAYGTVIFRRTNQNN